LVMRYLANLVNKQMEIPNVPNVILVAAALLRDMNFHFT
jgi:hypothetical protein